MFPGKYFVSSRCVLFHIFSGSGLILTWKDVEATRAANKDAVAPCERPPDLNDQWCHGKRHTDRVCHVMMVWRVTTHMVYVEVKMEIRKRWRR